MARVLQTYSQVIGYIWRLKPNIAKMVEKSELWKPLKAAKRYIAFHLPINNTAAMGRLGLPPGIHALEYFVRSQLPRPPQPAY